MLGANRPVVVGLGKALQLSDLAEPRALCPRAATPRGVAAAAPAGRRRAAAALPSSCGVSAFDGYIRMTTARLERLPKDVFVAALVGVLQLAITISLPHGNDGGQGLDAIAVVLLLAGPAALCWQSRAPVAVMFATLVPALLYMALDYPTSPVWLAAIIAFVSAVFMGRRLPAWILLGVAWAGLVFIPHVVNNADAPTVGKAIGIAVWLFLLGEFAEIARSKRERHLELERAEREKARAQAGQERLLIARELHDVLAHNVSLINVQAGVALHLLDEQPDRARPALEAIKDASSETLREMRSVLDILRRPGEQPPRSPTAGVAGLDELVSRTQAAGISVDARVTGEPRALPASVDLAVYRIVQEALTNVARHAHPAAALVRLAYGEDAIEIVVEDDGLRARDVERLERQRDRGHARAGHGARRRIRGGPAARRGLPGAGAAAAGRRAVRLDGER